jgi:imidazole glycerol-phosphate synthase subunit HisH
MITIIDYGLGNIRAFVNLFERLNVAIQIARKPEDLRDSTKLILPGVGAFDFAMTQLNRSGMRDEVEKQVMVNKIPVVGICVGMQMLARSSEEGVLPGLGWIDATVKKFDVSKVPFGTLLPHMGWNTIRPGQENPLLEGLNDQSRFYFLHSYYFVCDHDQDSIATTAYGITFTSAVNRDNIFGIQFHPEKSHHNGIRLLHNFARL